MYISQYVRLTYCLELLRSLTGRLVAIHLNPWIYFCFYVMKTDFWYIYNCFLREKENVK